MPRALGCLLAAGVLLAAPAPALAAPHEASARDALAAANRDPNVIRERSENGRLTHSVKKAEGHWEVAYFAGDREVALVVVDPLDGRVRESWTGYQIAWKMARGYPGAFGHSLNAPYVFLPLCALFLLGLVDWRRPLRVASLDLVVLLGFGVSNIFFNDAQIGVSVPLQYPLLVYLLARALWIGIRGRGRGLRPVWPASWLLIAALFLMGLRVGLNVADSGTIDVGYAGVVGAHHVLHGQPLYGSFPSEIAQGDTYGPVNYYAYVPFEAIWPWHGHWDQLPAAHAASIVFDVATFAMLALLGMRLRPGARGRKLGATLAFGWAAFPYTAYALQSNTNDTLVAALLVAALLVLARPLARGGVLALAAFTKFAPLLLAPLFATYSAAGAELGSPRRRRGSRSLLPFAVGFAAAAVAVMLWPAIDPGLATFWERTIASQARRESPFSIWGQVPALRPLRIVLIAAVGVLAAVFAFRPRRKTPTQVAALGAALLIAIQLTAGYWFYLYIVWFYPLLLVALAAIGDERSGEGRRPPSEGLVLLRRAGRRPHPPIEKVE